MLTQCAVQQYMARCAFTWTNAAVAAEETADVTSPSKAPPNWGQLIRRGRAADRKMMAAEMDISPSIVAKLLPLDYVMKDMNTNTVVKGNAKDKKQSKVTLNN